MHIAGSNGFCGFRYNPQMNAHGVRVREHQRSSAVCKDHSCLKSYATTKSVRIRHIAKLSRV
ncbi:MAG: hypothetical protein DRI57_01500 [Deltaproteobacteria bacterium]|nr:MAG: hypothetical protein DRI57_01500 [Deltaproteobacteria bacterium]